MLLADVPKWLSLLGRIDAGEPNPVLIVRGIQEGDRVTIGDTDHTPDESLGNRERSDEENREEKREVTHRCLVANLVPSAPYGASPKTR